MKTARPRASSPGALAVLALAFAGVACRQTVIVDPGATSGAGGSEDLDAAGPPEDGSLEGGGGAGGSSRDGGRFDGGFPSGFCSGQIQPLLATMRVPDLLLTVDRSSAMQSSFSDGLTRLAAVQQAVRALVQKYQHVVHFGYEEFPASSSTCGGGNVSVPMCCAGDVTAPMANAYGSIDRALHRCDNNGAGCQQAQRPLAGALAKCEATFSSTQNANGNRYLVAFVGGEPTCESDAVSMPCPDSIAEITKLARSSVSASVFGVGGETAGSACLDALAQAGGGAIPQASPYYHLTHNTTELGGALDPLVRTMAQESCHVDIRTPPADPNKVAVFFDATLVDIDSANGWTFDAGSTVSLTFHGTACDTLIKNAPRVDVVSGCTSPRHQ
ncbi:MAG TPA: hypothetical protein VHJ20_15980 [Polyangia bacterium]|nr:hypothetical protein [Polyangia bacterium]